MKKNFNKSERGFTIIEVVLVLAIGGLIFLVVFLALPGLQANQRDTQRRQVIGNAISAMVASQSNNKGKLPTADTADAASFKDWISSAASFAEPRTGDEYKVNEKTSDMGADEENLSESTIYFARAKANGEDRYPACGEKGAIEFQDDEKNSFVMTLLLDSGKEMYCQAS